MAALYRWFADHDGPHREMLAHVIFDADHEHVRDAMFALYYYGPGLLLTSADRAALLEVAEARATPSPVEIGLLEELVLLDRGGESGVSAEVHAVAARLGSHNEDFLAKLEESTKPIVYDWQSDKDERRAKYAAERQSVYQQVRDRHAKQAADVAAGQANILHRPAAAYLGRYSEFSREAPPEARVATFLGETLGEEALQGFMASLLREDLPSAQQISESHAAGKHWFVEIVLVCGIAERIRRGIVLDDISADAAQSAYMSWRRSTESNMVGKVEIGKPLEALVLTDEAAPSGFSDLGRAAARRPLRPYLRYLLSRQRSALVAFGRPPRDRMAGALPEAAGNSRGGTTRLRKPARRSRSAPGVCDCCP